MQKKNNKKDKDQIWCKNKIKSNDKDKIEENNQSRKG
jgi:hypothetical protein